MTGEATGEIWTWSLLAGIFYLQCWEYSRLRLMSLAAGRGTAGSAVSSFCPIAVAWVNLQDKSEPVLLRWRGQKSSLRRQ